MRKAAYDNPVIENLCIAASPQNLHAGIERYLNRDFVNPDVYYNDIFIIPAACLSRIANSVMPSG
jgi:hypothetical protein